MSDITFPLLGEALALDLINTRPQTSDGTVDLLASPTGLREWLAAQRHRLVHELPDHEPTAADLATVHAVREHVAAALAHARRGLAPPPEALDGLNRAHRGAPGWRELTAAGALVSAHRRRAGPLGAQLAAELADAAANLLTDPATVAAVRNCEAPDCVLLFLPAHPRRRWCSAARCGNRTRVKRYYHRHRSTPPTLE